MTDTTEKPGPIWVDADEYCRRTLLGGAPIPWADSGELASFVSRSAALTRTDAVLIDLGAAWSSRLADPVVLAAMARQTRRARPLRALLDDPTGRALIVDVLSTAAAAARVPVVITLPAPGRWARLAAVGARLDDQPSGDDTAEAAAMYIAASLGDLSGQDIAALVVDEGRTATEDLPDPAAYGPIANAADHAGWPVVVRTDGAPCWSRGPSPAVATWIGATPPDEAHGDWGLVGDLSNAVPDGSPAAPRIVRIPSHADPGDVTATVRSWK